MAANQREMADLLEQQMADGYRVKAYRRAADTVAALGRPVSLILKKAGIDGLVAQPPVGLLLNVDREYREKAAAGALRLIAPRRFNPGGEAWLPVLHTRHGEWVLTALFSYTRRAHEFGRTSDRVVIYFHTDDTIEGQVTVVT